MLAFTGTDGACRTPLTDSTDVRISPDDLRAEPSVFVSPSDPNLILLTTNRWNPTPPIHTDLSGASPCWSQDAGRTWACQDAGTGDDPNGGDPTCAIGRHGTATPTSGRFYSGYLYQDGIKAAFSIDLGSTWSPRQVEPPPPEFFLDKPHLWVNNNPDPADEFKDRAFCAWADRSDLTIKVRYSIDFGETWIGLNTLQDPQQRVDLEDALGVNLQVGPSSAGANWNAYATWAIRRRQPLGDEKAIGFARSTNGGFDWALQKRIETVGPSNQPLYVRGTQFSGLADGAKFPDQPPPYALRRIGANPSMTVDRSTGHVYIVWCNRGDPLQDDAQAVDTDIFVIRSTDEGETWDLPVRVNDDVNADPNAPNDQWFPWIAWDECTGMLAVIFYDTRNHPYAPPTSDHSADVYVAVSQDDGATWTNFQVSDGSGAYSCLFNPANDYIGIAVGDGRAYPVWADDRQRVPGTDPPYPNEVYTSPFLLWGIEAKSVEHTIEHIPGGTFRLTVTWETNLPAHLAELVLVPPPDIVPDPNATLTYVVDGTRHTAIYEAVCQPSHLYWTYTCKNRRNGCAIARESAPRTFRILHCLD